MPLFLIFALLVAQSAASYVLDDSTKKIRPTYTFSNGKCLPQKEAEITPLEESIQRGKCEPFAQGVGQIRIQKPEGSATGAGALIAPNAILSAAHTLAECLKPNAQCWFEGSSSTSEFSLRIVKALVNPHFVKTNPRSPTKTIDPVDVGIGILEKPLRNLPPILHLHMAPESLNKDGQTAFAVSYNQIMSNRTGKKNSNQPLRHIVVTELERVQETLRHGYKYPKELEAKCEKEERPPNRFIYNGKIFLQGIMQPGDSGGPLIARYKGLGDEIIGVATSTGLVNCKKKTGRSSDIFHPVYPSLEWIRDVLLENNVDIAHYQPQLRELPATK